MLGWFIEWTTQLNHSNRFAYAIVTVVTMATVGIGIAVVAEALLKRIGTGRSAERRPHQPPRH